MPRPVSLYGRQYLGSLSLDIQSCWSAKAIANLWIVRLSGCLGPVSKGDYQHAVPSIPSMSIDLQAIYVPADDLTDPAPATTFAHLDATTVLSRSIAELGIYPAVDPLDSTSRMLNARIIGQEHYDIARGVQRVLQVHPILPLSSSLLQDHTRSVNRVCGVRSLVQSNLE